MPKPRVVIIGGGYSGVCVAVQLAQQSAIPLEITVVEPESEVGRGVAYGSTDPDHRLNGPAVVHYIYAEDTNHFARWVVEEEIADDDPDAQMPDGRVFVRRSELGRYLGLEFAKNSRDNPSGSNLRHVQASAQSMTAEDAGYQLTLDTGEALTADAVVLCTNNSRPAIPPPFNERLEDHPAFVPNPWDLDRLCGIKPGGEVLIIGTGLTMADVAMTVMRRSPDSRITAVSRRGLYPKPQRVAPPPRTLWEEMNLDPPDFVTRHGTPETVVKILRALRSDIRQLEPDGIEWQVAFDFLRDAAHVLWPNLPDEEKNRFFRHLAPWYESHRFRLPPQIEARVGQAMENGQVRLLAGSLVSAEADGDGLAVGIRPRGSKDVAVQTFDAVVNCTGPTRSPAKSGSPFLVDLVALGILVESPFAMGVEVDGSCAALNASGRNDPLLRVIGPMTRARFGEVNGVPAIGFQVYRMAGDLCDQLRRL